MPMLLSVKSRANCTPGASPTEYDDCRLLIGEVNANMFRFGRSAGQVGEKAKDTAASQIEWVSLALSLRSDRRGVVRVAGAFRQAPS